MNPDVIMAARLLYQHDESERCAVSDTARQAINSLARAYAIQCGKLDVALSPALQNLVLTFIETAYLEGAKSARAGGVE